MLGRACVVAGLAVTLAVPDLHAVPAAALCHDTGYSIYKQVTAEANNRNINCSSTYRCYQGVELSRTIRLDNPLCDPTAGSCQVDLSVTLRFPGNRQNIDQYGLFSSATPIVYWYIGASPPSCDPVTSMTCFQQAIGICGLLGYDGQLDQDLAETLLRTTTSCADLRNGVPNNTLGHYSILGYACGSSPACHVRKEVAGLDFTPEAVAAAIDCPDPRKDECKECVANLGDGTVPVGGDAACVVPGQDGPKATLRYTGRGAGHPGFPGTTAWNQTLGRYWSHDYAQRIVEDPDDTHVWLITESASFREFSGLSGGVYTTVSPSDEYRTLVRTGSGWTLTDLAGTVTSFDDDGLWLQTVDRNGNAKVGTYSGNLLTAVTFPDNRREDFTYDGGTGKLASITEVGVDNSTTRSWSYTWTGNDLTRIDRPDGTAWVLSYDDPTNPGYMTLMELEGTDHTSRRVERGWEYDTKGNAVRTWKGATSFSDPDAVDKWELAFDDPTRPTQTTVTDPLSNTSTYQIGRDPLSRKPRVTSISGDCPTCGLGPNSVLAYGDGANPMRPTQITDGNGNQTAMSYNAHGQMVTRTEAVNTPALTRETTYSYDATHPALVTAMEQPSVAGGATVRRAVFDRDSAGNPITQWTEGVEGTDTLVCPAGNPGEVCTATATSFNGAGQPLTVDPPGYATGDVTSFSYDEDNDTIEDRGGLIPFARTDPLVGTTLYGYDPLNRRTTVTDPNGVVTETVYDELNRVTQLIRQGASPAGDLVTEYQYDVFGDLAATILPRGNVLAYGYDDAGRLLSVERRVDDTTPGERTFFTLDPAGSRTQEDLQRPDGLGGWITESSTGYQYSTRCHLDRVLHADGTATDYDYDCNGNLAAVWDAAHPSAGGTNSPTQIYEYDALDRLERLRQPWPEYAAGWDDPTTANEAITTYGYDVQDHLTSVIDAEGSETDYAYSDRDLLLEEQSPVSGATDHLYNLHGQLVSTTDARGVTVTRTVDAADRVTAVDYPDPAIDTTYAYDTAPTVCAGTSFPLGRLSSITRDSEAVDFCYDRFGRQTRDGELTYAYDVNGNPAQIGYPGSVSAAYAYDFADRPLSLSVTTPSGTVPVASGATYLPSGPLQSLTLGNGTSEARTFTPRYFPESITWEGSPARAWDYTTDAMGNVTAIERTIACAGDVVIANQTLSTTQTLESCAGLEVGPNVTLTDTADVTLRAAGGVSFDTGFVVQTGARMSVEPGATVDPPELRLFDYQDGPYFLTRGDGPWGERDWDYDRIGNRLSETRERSTSPAVDTYAYLANGSGGDTAILNQIQLSPSGTADYAWDAAGNLDTLTRGANHLDFTSDDASRLAGIDRGDGMTVFNSAVFHYDGRSFLRRAEDPASGATVEPLYSSSGLLQALLEHDSPTGPDHRHTVFYFAGRPVAQLTQDAGGESWEYLTTDHLGAPLMAADEAGALTWSGGFEPFGQDPAADTPGSALAAGVFLRFPGQWETDLWKDASLGTGGLYYNVHRWYQYGTERYTRPDPVFLAGYSSYIYALSDSINVKDPLGLLPDTDSETTCLICTVFAEARGTPGPCQQAVASVIVNRLKHCRNWGIPSTVCGIVSAARQFDGYGNSNYQHCEDCQNPEGELADTVGHIGQGFPVAPDASYYGNNDPGVIRYFKGSLGLTPVNYPSCTNFVFFDKQRDPFVRPSAPTYCN